MEILTRAIANEYRDRALLLPSNGLQDIGERRKLREELQECWSEFCKEEKVDPGCVDYVERVS